VSMNPNDNPQAGGDLPPPPPPSHASSTPPSTTGFDLQSLIRQWQDILLKPSVATFDAQQPYANWQTVGISLAILAVVRAIFDAITRLEYHLIGARAPSVGGLIGNFITTFVVFFIFAGILYGIARAFNGTGSFALYAYLLALFLVPLGIVSSIAGVIPLLGGLVAFAAGLYELYLTALATASAHRLTQGQSWAVVAIAIVVGLVIALIVGIFLAALLLTVGLVLPGH